ncbi:MAG TPA: hypothetical protein VEL07_11590 [Planctomycetota bacterium]|nr:hypothetical protein [Planctomycetota bacterium]
MGAFRSSAVAVVDCLRRWSQRLFGRTRQDEDDIFADYPTVPGMRKGEANGLRRSTSMYSTPLPSLPAAPSSMPQIPIPPPPRKKQSDLPDEGELFVDGITVEVSAKGPSPATASSAGDQDKVRTEVMEPAEPTAAPLRRSVTDRIGRRGGGVPAKDTGRVPKRATSRLERLAAAPDSPQPMTGKREPVHGSRHSADVISWPKGAQPLAPQQPVAAPGNQPPLLRIDTVWRTPVEPLPDPFAAADAAAPVDGKEKSDKTARHLHGTDSHRQT